MKRNELPKFAAALDSLAALFSRELDDAASGLYLSAVGTLTIEQFEEAVRLAAAKCQHFPPPAELMGLVVVEKSHKLAALDAWPEFMKLVRRSSADHSDPVAKDTMRQMGGGKALAQRSEDDLEKWGKKEFCKLYEENAARLPPMMLNEAPAAGLLT